MVAFVIRERKDDGVTTTVVRERTRERWRILRRFRGRDHSDREGPQGFVGGVRSY